MSRMIKLFIRPTWMPPLIFKIPRYFLGLLLGTCLLTFPFLLQATSSTSEHSEQNNNISTFIGAQQFQKILANFPNKSNIILCCNTGSKATALHDSPNKFVERIE